MSSLILITLAIGVASAVAVSLCLLLVEGDGLPSLSKDEQGNRNPMLGWWLGLTLVHIVLLFGWALFLGHFGIIRLREEPDEWWHMALYFCAYWAHFELFYWSCHRTQHCLPVFGWLTGHRGEMSAKFHHGMRPPYGPDMITAFAAHPADSFVVQLSAQSPWITTTLVCAASGGSPPSMGAPTYCVIIAWLAFIGIRAHSRKGFGGSYHCKHHDDPSSGPYSFSGYPERLLRIQY